MNFRGWSLRPSVRSKKKRGLVARTNRVWTFCESQYHRGLTSLLSRERSRLPEQETAEQFYRES